MVLKHINNHVISRHLHRTASPLGHCSPGLGLITVFNTRKVTMQRCAAEAPQKPNSAQHAREETDLQLHKPLCPPARLHRASAHTGWPSEGRTCSSSGSHSSSSTPGADSVIAFTPASAARTARPAPAPAACAARRRSWQPGSLSKPTQSAQRGRRQHPPRHRVLGAQRSQSGQNAKHSAAWPATGCVQMKGCQQSL